MSLDDANTPQEDRLNELVEDYLASARKPGARREEIRARLLEENPGLAEALEKRLRIVDGVLDAAKENVRPSDRTGAQGDRTRVEGDRSTIALREHPLNCPHCGQKIRVVAPEVVEITCLSCGSFVPIDERLTYGREVDAPESIGGFRVLGRLGEGGFGTAYRAHDSQLDRTVAVKVPRRGVFSNGSERERFLREARAAARLKHPNIVQVHSISDDPDEPYIVSELIEGPTLSELIQGQRLDFKDTAQILLKVAEAVEFAHQEGIIHRDLKPSNILLDETRKPYITDFGLALNREADATMTMDGELLGTPAYMSPEQASGKHSQLTTATDIYSLGVILYRMLSGELPFRGSQRMLIHQVMYDDPKSPRALNDRIPRDLETIALKALAKEPTRRYESAKALADDLQRWLNDEPILARPISSIGKIQRWRRRNPWLATFAASTVGLLLMLTIGASIWAIQANIEGRRLQTAIEGSNRRLSEHQLSNGFTSLRRQHCARALVWFTASAATSATTDIILSEEDRIRIGMTRAAIPKLIQFNQLDAGNAVSATVRVGNVIFAGTYSGNVYVIDSATGESRLLTSYEKAIQQFVASPAGDRVAIRPGSKTVSLYNPEDLQLIAELEHAATCRDVQFSPDGSQLASGANDGLLRLWNAQTGEKSDEVAHTNKAVQKVRFATATRLVTACGVSGKESCVVQAFELGEIEPIFPPIELAGHIHDLRLDSESQVVAASTSAGVLATIEIATGRVLGKVNLTSAVDRTFALPNGHWLSVLANGSLQIRDQELALLRSTNPDGPTSALCMDASSQLLALGMQDGRVRIYWAQTLDPLSPYLDCGPLVKSLNFDSANNRLKVGSSDGSFRYWDFASLAPSPQMMQHDAPIIRARFDTSGALIASASRDGTARIWDPKTGQQLATLNHDGAIVVDALFSPSGDRLATFDVKGNLKFWNRQGEPIGGTVTHDAAIQCAAWSQDGSFLVLGGIDGTIEAWSPGSDSPLFAVEHQKAVVDITFAPSQSSSVRFASASQDGNVSVWNDSGQLVAGPFNHQDTEVYSVDFLSNSDRLLTRANDNRLRLWDPTSPSAPVRLIEFPYDPAAAVLSTDNRLYTAMQNGLLERQDDWKQTWQIQTDGIRFKRMSIAIGSELMTGKDLLLVTTGMEQNAILRQSEQGAALFFDGSTGRLLSPPLQHFGEVVSAELDRNGSHIMTASSDHTLRVWDIQSADQDLAFLRDHASILSGKHLSDNGRLVVAPAQDLVDRYAALKRASPELFSTTQAETQSWKNYLTWLQDNLSHPSATIEPEQ